MPARSLREAGFTLLELMAVLVLIGLLATVGIPNLLRAKIRAEMLSQVKMVRQAIAVSRINAIKGGRPVAMAMQNINGIATLVAWVDEDGGQDFDSGERVVGRWPLPPTFSLTEDPTMRLYRLGGSGPDGMLFLPTGSAIVAEAGTAGAGEAGTILTDLKGNQFRIRVTGGTGTVIEEMWNPTTSSWDPNARQYWRY
jgi:prepilin-type N-terminal cleavage/methylation domain-containing protein